MAKKKSSKIFQLGCSQDAAENFSATKNTIAKRIVSITERSIKHSAKKQAAGSYQQAIAANKLFSG
ncbi:MULTISPECIES: hypothetical protein [Spirosoma]|uniref:Uncharacterized protein n=1 Tax=Spirosoma liriopis TaxID=2937440 RepID=A0ABT0HG80_9BACT|nr:MULTISPECIES: hypothetical protein [Spirosoma]MCK8491171.1 hypothetical protein [Spirosoma liriopis]UHG90547.1 hypothetical protein LQ777_20140 [Spirosoma oryzicola]